MVNVFRNHGIPVYRNHDGCFKFPVSRYHVIPVSRQKTLRNAHMRTRSLNAYLVLSSEIIKADILIIYT